MTDGGSDRQAEARVIAAWVSLGVGLDTTIARSILRSLHASTDSTSPESGELSE